MPSTKLSVSVDEDMWAAALHLADQRHDGVGASSLVQEALKMYLSTATSEEQAEVVRYVNLMRADTLQRFLFGRSVNREHVEF